MNDWRDHAACRGRTEWFAGDPFTIAVARRICASCPVRQLCAGEALQLLDAGEQLSGIWAGVSLGQGSGQQRAFVKLNTIAVRHGEDGPNSATGVRKSPGRTRRPTAVRP